MEARIQNQIGRSGGRITLAAFMEVVLYDPEHGYYLSAERKPGRGGDFLTSPEASPLFGITLARQIVECWERLGAPDHFSIREFGSGVGGLAYDILAGIDSESPACFAATTYRLVERNEHRQADALAAFGEVGLSDKVVAESGPELVPITGLILSNEVADAFPAHRLVFDGGRFHELWVEPVGEGWAWSQGALSDGGVEGVQQLADGGVVPVDGGIYDVSPAVTTWFRETCLTLERGYAITIDYGYQARELYQDHRLNGTLRGYYGHTVTDDPFVRIGEQDLTIHVDFSALQRAGEAVGLHHLGLTTQGAMLASLGLGDHLMAMQQEPGMRMDEYLATQAVVMRLIDPGGLGRFRVQIMAKDVPTSPPLRSFAVNPPPF